MALRHASARIGGGNVSPPLAWEGVPAEAKRLLFVLEDTDAPVLRPILHTVALFEVGQRGLVEGGLVVGARGVAFFRASRGRLGYFGPGPVAGHGPHRYSFTLFALGAGFVAPPPGSTIVELAQAAKGQVLARGRVTGTYER